MKIKYYNYIVLLIFSMLFWPALAHATPTLSLEIEGGFYDTVTETWVTHDTTFYLELITSGNSSGGNNYGERYDTSSNSGDSHDSGSNDGDSHNGDNHGGGSNDGDSHDDDNHGGGSNDGDSHDGESLFGVDLVIVVPGDESGIDIGTVSLNGGFTVIPVSAFRWGNPLFSRAQEGGNQYPSHDIYPAWYAIFKVNNENNFNLPETFTYDAVVTGFSWVHFDAFGYYETATGCNGKNTNIKSEFVPPSHDGEYSAEVMAVPEPSTFYLLAAGLIGFLLFKIPDIKKKLQA